MITSEKNLTFHDINEFGFSVKKGIGIETIEELSHSRNEPDWLRNFDRDPTNQHQIVFVIR